MTDREIMQQALEAIMDAMMVSGGISDKSFEAVKALRKRLARPEQEPVARVTSSGPHDFPLLEWLSADHSFRCSIGDLLYTAPPQREWQGLTDEEISAISKSIPGETILGAAMRLFAREIEAKLKEKND